jgi:hypothetical protein
MKQQAQNSGRPLLTFLRHTPFYEPRLPLFREELGADFDRAALAKFIGETRASVATMETFIKLQQNRLEIDRYCDPIVRTQNCLLMHFANAYLEEKKKTEKRRAREAAQQFSWDRFIEKYVDPSIEIHFWFAILNLSCLVPDAQLVKLIAMFTAYVNREVVRRVQMWGSNHMEIIRPLCSLVPQVRHAFKLPYGARLSQLIETMGRIARLL